jgi:hypothetical protein
MTKESHKKNTGIRNSSFIHINQVLLTVGFLLLFSSHVRLHSTIKAPVYNIILVESVRYILQLIDYRVFWSEMFY